VWTETERILGRSLEVTVDEAELLAAVDALYDPLIAESERAVSPS
jgi:hypothetical protein